MMDKALPILQEQLGWQWIIVIIVIFSLIEISPLKIDP